MLHLPELPIHFPPERKGIELALVGLEPRLGLRHHGLAGCSRRSQGVATASPNVAAVPRIVWRSD